MKGEYEMLRSAIILGLAISFGWILMAAIPTVNGKVGMTLVVSGFVIWFGIRTMKTVGREEARKKIVRKGGMNVVLNLFLGGICVLTQNGGAIVLIPFVEPYVDNLFD